MKRFCTKGFSSLIPYILHSLILHPPSPGRYIYRQEIGCVVDGYVTGYASGAFTKCSGPVQRLVGPQYVHHYCGRQNDGLRPIDRY